MDTADDGGTLPMISLALLLACPAEQLGILLPKTGVEGVSMEDLTRDHGALSTAEDGGAAWMGTRLSQMGLVVEVRPGGATCGRAGEGEPTFSLWTAHADGPVAAAALISLAKAFDAPSGGVARRFCWGRPAGDLAAAGTNIAELGLGPVGDDVDLRPVLMGVRAAARELMAGDAPPR